MMGGGKKVASIFSGRSENHTDFALKRATVSPVEAEQRGGGEAAAGVYCINRGPKP